jgi:hypothetical protein
MGVVSFSGQTSVIIKAGQAVAFVDPVSGGGVHHLVTGTGGAFTAVPGAPNEFATASGQAFSPGTAIGVAFPNSGTFLIKCTIHPAIHAGDDYRDALMGCGKALRCLPPRAGTFTGRVPVSVPPRRCGPLSRTALEGGGKARAAVRAAIVDRLVAQRITHHEFCRWTMRHGAGDATALLFRRAVAALSAPRRAHYQSAGQSATATTPGALTAPAASLSGGGAAACRGAWGGRAGPRLSSTARDKDTATHAEVVAHPVAPVASHISRDTLVPDGTTVP